MCIRDSHGIEPKSEERRLFDSFQEEFWNSDYWDNKPYKKSDFINNFEEYEYFDRKAHREKKRKAK